MRTGNEGVRFSPVGAMEDCAVQVDHNKERVRVRGGEGEERRPEQVGWGGLGDTARAWGGWNDSVAFGEIFALRRRVGALGLWVACWRAGPSLALLLVPRLLLLSSVRLSSRRLPMGGFMRCHLVRRSWVMETFSWRRVDSVMNWRGPEGCVMKPIEEMGWLLS